MGIDHGLGGRGGNSEKQKRKQLQKQKRNHKMMSLVASEAGAPLPLPLQKGPQGRKKEVIFDEGSRVAWLTGFRKRKTERRKQGLALGILKAKKMHQEAIRGQRSALLQQSTGGKAGKGLDLGGGGDEDEDETDEDEVGGGDGHVEGEEEVFEDENTLSMFGGSVSVVVGAGVADDDIDPFHNPMLGNEDDEEGEEDQDKSSDVDDGDTHSVSNSITSERKSGNFKHQKRQPSQFEKALKEVGKKGLLDKKKKKFGGDGGGGKVGKGSKGKGGKVGKDTMKKAKASSLMHKAMGANIVKNTFKGSNKRR